MKLEGENRDQIKIKLKHEIHTYIHFYEKMSNDKIDMAKQRGFFTGDIDELIEKLKNY